ncbi:c-type cytochrome [Chitinophagaceae bacterium MMS25-I14]
MKKIIRLSVIAAASVLLAQCAPKTAKTVSASGSKKVEAATYTDDQVAQGKTIYNNNCGKCHGLKNVGDFDKTAWEHILPSMAKKARIDDQQTALVRAYVMTNAKAS